MLFFLDTEWADQHERRLVSLALVGEDQNLVFYAERGLLSKAPTPFVRNVVYPLLQRGDVAHTNAIFGMRLREFINAALTVTAETPCIAYDYIADRLFFESAYWGFTRMPRCAYIPVDYYDLASRHPEYLQEYERYFRSHDEAATHRHNALVDARAARYAVTASVSSFCVTGSR